jgi:CheY-like chemotaxis protein
MKTVLLAEDNEDDVFALKRACLRSGIPHLLKVVADGKAAIDYLSGKGEYSDRTAYPFPDVVFLDVNMPRCNGHEALEWIRENPNLKNLPVAMLTASVLKEDVDRAYQLGVTSYLKKTASLGGFGQGVRIILKYWLELNVPPAGEYTTGSAVEMAVGPTGKPPKDCHVLTMAGDDAWPAMR